MLDSGRNVIVWHDDLKLNPAENANVILSIHCPIVMYQGMNALFYLVSMHTAE